MELERFPALALRLVTIFMVVSFRSGSDETSGMVASWTWSLLLRQILEMAGGGLTLASMLIST